MFALDGGRNLAALDAPRRGMRSSGLSGGIAGRLISLLDAEQPRWFLWCPVFLGVGIGCYFSLTVEPVFYHIIASGIIFAGLALFLKRSMFSVLLLSALFAIITGFTAAKVRTELVRAPKIMKTMGPAQLKGWVERIEKRGPKGRRITLSVVSSENFTPDILPKRVRLFDKSIEHDLSVGDYVRTKAVLRPPPTPSLPGGYDFARGAWYRGLGGVGYSVESFTQATPAPAQSLNLWFWVNVERMRGAVGARINGHLTGQAAAVAIALLTGERSQLDMESRDALRHSGLAHILAISGLHMAVMSGAVFWLIRALLAMSSLLVLTQPIKKWSAFIAILGACFYLALSGASAATQRAFIMVVLLYVAVLVDRPALSLRNVAIAALVILTVWPESLLNIGFQMSFAAVAALISFYEAWNQRQQRIDYPGRGYGAIDRGRHFFMGIAMTTIVAGLAIAPLSAYHFGREAGYGLLANLTALPVFSFLTMPMALASLMAMPFGLEAYPLAVMGWSTEIILAIAAWVSALPGAVLYIAQVPQFALVILVSGALWLMIWQRGWRYLGLIAIALGLAFFQSGARPDIYISGNGRVIAVRNLDMGDGSIGLSSARGASRSYVLGRWLEKDGDKRSASEAARGKNYKCDFDGCVTKVKGFVVAHNRNAAGLRDDCMRADILITALAIKTSCKNPKLIIDKRSIGQMGGHAIYIDGATLNVEGVETMRGRRPWSRHPGH